MMTKIKIGTGMFFELRKDLTKSAQPRYNSQNIDEGASGRMAEGIVISVTNEFITLKYNVEGFVGAGEARIPYLENKHYEKNQWSWPGYFIEKQSFKCECGAEKCKTTHARYCPLYGE